jgi:hypothetical protein
VVFGTHTLAQILDAWVSSCLCDGAVMMHRVHMVWCNVHVMMHYTTFIALDRSTHDSCYQLLVSWVRMCDIGSNLRRTRPRWQNSDLERRNYDRLNLNDIIRYNFLVWLNFKLSSVLTRVRLNDFQSSSYSCKCICNIMIYVYPIRSSPNEKLYQIYKAYV